MYQDLKFYDLRGRGSCAMARPYKSFSKNASFPGKPSLHSGKDPTTESIGMTTKEGSIKIVNL